MSVKIPVPPKEELMEKYYKYGTTISSLAREYNTTNPTVRKWLIKYNICRKDHKQASREANNMNRTSLPSREELMNYYNNNSILDTYSHFSIGQKKLYEWLEYYDIPIRSLSESCCLGKNKQHKDIQFQESEVREVYDKHKHIGISSQELGVSYSHMKNLMRRYNINAVIPWRSAGEDSLYNQIKKLDPCLKWETNDKKLIAPYEIDIICHEKKIAVEYCGLYWHSEYYGSKEKTYHKNKFMLCKEKGYELITVFESDDMSKVISLLKSKLGLTKRVFARKCKVSIISSVSAASFHNKHHLHKAVGGKIHYGLYYNEELLMVLSMGKSRFSKEYEWECVRMTGHSEYNVIGGASKLFKKFFIDYDVKSCVTFSDLRFGEGKVYQYCGFTFKEHTSPNYWYFDKNKPTKIHSRVKFQKHKLKEKLIHFDSNKTEYKNMLDNKYDRIWDCGNALWEIR